MNKLVNKIFLSAVIVFLFATALSAAVTEVDTTITRDVVKVKKSTGEKIADIPGEILKLPFYMIEEATYAVATNPPLSTVLPLFSFGEEAKPYIPIVGYNSNAGLKLGMSLKLKHIFYNDDYLKLKGYYSLNDYQSYQIKYKTSKFIPGSNGLVASISYRKKPRESFYGVGNYSNRYNDANYNLEKSEFKFSVPLRLTDSWTFNINGGYIAANIFDGDEDDLICNLDSLILSPCYNTQTDHLLNSRYFIIGGSIAYDSRDNIGQPTKGNQIIFDYAKYIGHDLSSNKDLNYLALDLRSYLHIWKKRLFAVRFFLESVNASGGDVDVAPIYLAPSLGGLTRLRGFNRGRFLDNDIALLSVEYRYPIYDNFDAFVFLDEGRAFTDIFDERFFYYWKYSTGFGLRMWKSGGVVIMGQIAFSKESTKLYFELGAEW